VPDLKFGRLPGSIPVGLRFLDFYRAGTLPQAPPKVDVPVVPAQSDGTPWGMLGNDSYGDCGVAGIDHGFMVAASVTGETESFPSSDEVVQYYLGYTGGQDTGVVLSDFLGYVHQNGFFGHSVAAYAPVAVHDIPTLHFAVDAYDFAYTGIKVTAAMQQAYAKGDSWDLDDLFSQTVGGHCVPVVGYDSKYLYCITWGKVQPITYACWHYISDEAWAVIPGEIVSKGDDGRGINLAALQADLGALTS